MLKACNEGNLDVVRSIIKASDARQLRDILRLKDNHGYTALHHAVTANNFEIVQELLQLPKAGLMVFAENFEGGTPLIVACDRRNIDIRIVEALIKFNVTVAQYVNNEGVSAYHSAVRNCRTDVLRILVEHAPEWVCLKDRDQETPLHLAVRWDNFEAIEFLLYYSVCDPGELNVHGMTAFDLGTLSAKTTFGDRLSLKAHYLREVFFFTYDSVDEYLNTEHHDGTYTGAWRLGVLNVLHADDSNLEKDLVRTYLDRFNLDSTPDSHFPLLLLHHKVTDCSMWERCDCFDMFCQNLMKISFEYFVTIITHLCSKNFPLESYINSAIFVTAIKTCYWGNTEEEKRLNMFKMVKFLVKMGMDVNVMEIYFNCLHCDALWVDCIMLYKTTYLDDYGGPMFDHYKKPKRSNTMHSLKEWARLSVRNYLFEDMKMKSVAAAEPYLTGVPKAVRNYLTFNTFNFE